MSASRRDVCTTPSQPVINVPRMWCPDQSSRRLQRGNTAISAAVVLAPPRILSIFSIVIIYLKVCCFSHHLEYYLFIKLFIFSIEVKNRWKFIPWKECNKIKGKIFLKSLLLMNYFNILTHNRNKINIT